MNRLESQPLVKKHDSSNHNVAHMCCMPIAIKPLTLSIIALSIGFIMDNGADGACDFTKTAGLALSGAALLSGLCVCAIISAPAGLDAIEQYKRGANKIDKIVQFTYYVGVPVAGTLLGCVSAIRYLAIPCSK